MAQQAELLTLFKTKPIGDDGLFVLGWQQALQQIVQTQFNAPKAYLLTRSQRLALFTKNLTIGSTVWETDVLHLQFWNGTAWVQLV